MVYREGSEGRGGGKWGKGEGSGEWVPPCPPPHMWIYRMFCQGPFPKAGWTDSSCKFRRNYLLPLPSSNYSWSSVRVWKREKRHLIDDSKHRRDHSIKLLDNRSSQLLICWNKWIVPFASYLARTPIFAIFHDWPLFRVNVSGNRCESDCRSRGREFDPDPVPYFLGDWSWNNFYGHSPPFRWSIQEGLLSFTSESLCTKYWLTACSSLPRKKCG